MRWKRPLAIAAAVVVALVAVGGGYIWYAAPWKPPVVIADPGAGGRRVADRGLLANYWAGNSSGIRPAVLTLGGSEGGLGDGAAGEARELAARGYAVLQLSYFRGPGQNAKLENLPLEYFTTALDWLGSRPDVDRTCMAVVGGSKGAEAALLIATRHPELKAIVAAMPSSVVWAGVDWNFGKVGSSWSERGKPLPWLDLGAFDFARVGKEGLVTMYAAGLATLPQHPDAAIPVERIKAPVLLICGESDKLWPSCPMARQVEARAREPGGPAVTILAYAGAGHGVQGRPRAADDPDIAKLGSMGGSGAGNNRALIDNWPKLLAFLDAALKPAGGTTP